jgi:hypothetical protein
MMDRAILYMERVDVNRVYTLTEMRIAAGVSVRSQYRLAQQLLASGMVERVTGGYQVVPWLRLLQQENDPYGMHEERRRHP